VNPNNPIQPEQTTPQPQAQPVMDIQRPQRPVDGVVQPGGVTVPNITAEPSLTPPPQQFVPQQMTPQPPIEPAAPTPNIAADATEVGAPNYEQQHTALNKQIRSKRRGLMAVIIITIIVTIGLIGAAGYMYWQSRNKQNVPAVTEPVNNCDSDDGRVDAAEVDAATQEIDDALNSLNDSEDFSTNDVSDDGIGL